MLRRRWDVPDARQIVAMSIARRPNVVSAARAAAASGALEARIAELSR